jgi:hypothetical protein
VYKAINSTTESGTCQMWQDLVFSDAHASIRTWKEGSKQAAQRAISILRA